MQQKSSPLVGDEETDLLFAPSLLAALAAAMAAAAAAAAAANLACCSMDFALRKDIISAAECAGAMGACAGCCSAVFALLIIIAVSISDSTLFLNPAQYLA